MNINGHEVYLSFLKGKSFEHRGDYDETTIYYNTNTLIDCVLYNGTSYFCKKTTTAGILPTNTEYWGIMAQGGEQGSGGQGGGDLSNYYTKDEVDNLIINTLNTGV